jgi:SAM-dependent methyltransferase
MWGSKWLPWFAREMHYGVSGVDYSEEGCVRARASLTAAGVEGDIHCADFHRLGSSFCDKYDVVTSFGVVEHFEDPAPILKIFSGHLRPGGLLLIFVPNMARLVGSMIKRLDRPLFDTHVLFDLKQFRGFHEAAGLDVRFAAYTGWADFQATPVDKVGALAGLVYKNLAYGMNRFLLPSYRAFQDFRPSRHGCAIR